MKDRLKLSESSDGRCTLSTFDPLISRRFVNQSSITAFVKDLFEKHFFAIAGWLSKELKLPPAFVRYPSYPGMSVVVKNQRVLEFNFLGQPLSGEKGNYAFVETTNEAACFVPYGSKGPMVTIDADALALEAGVAGIPEEALLEILVLHEMVHACMMGSIAQTEQNHPWVEAQEFRYIHETVALKVCEFGLPGLLKVATPEHVKKYLSHIQAVSKDRDAGAFYEPYFETYRAVALGEFWAQLRASQPAPGIFEVVESLQGAR